MVRSPSLPRPDHLQSTYCRPRQSPQRLHLIIRVFIIALPFSALGQSEKLSIQRYTTETGLLSNSVSHLCQDSRGYLYIGTAEGLSIYDGHDFTHYRTKEGLPSNFVYCIYEQRTSPGTIWVGTTNGLALFRGDQFVDSLLDTSERSKHVHSIAEDKLGRLWCGTFDGLFVIRNGDVVKVDLAIDTINGMSVMEGVDSLMWVAVNNLLLAFSPRLEAVRRIHLSSSILNYVTTAISDPYGNIWIGLADSTCALYRNGTLVHRKRIHAGNVNTLIHAPDSILYIGTRNGLLTIPSNRFTDSEFAVIGRSEGLPNCQVNFGMVDREGSLWLSYEGEGLVRLTQTGVQTFDIPRMPEAYNNMRGTSDSAGHFWLISGDSLIELKRLHRHSWRLTKHPIEAGRGAGKPTTVLYDRWNRLWVGLSDFSIRCYTIARDASGNSRIVSSHHVQTPRTASSPLSAFMIDRKDRLWCGNGFVINHKLNSVIWDFRSSGAIPDHDLRTLAEDQSGRIYIGGYTRGMAIVDEDSTGWSIKTLRPPSDLPSGFIRAMCEDNSGNMWIGTRHHGCIILGIDGMRVLTSVDGLPSDAVWSIARDSTGMMLLGTSMGLAAVNPVTLTIEAVGNNLVRDPVVTLGVTASGEVWYVTPHSFGLLERQGMRTSSPGLDVKIAAMTVDEQPVAITDEMVFPYDRNNCSFRFLAVSFRNTHDIRYQYKLRGLEEDWQPFTSERTVTYASLSPGDYTFEVRASRMGSDEIGKNATVSFSILSPVWERWWFRGGAIVIAGAMVLNLYRRRIGYLERQRQVQREFSRQLMESQETERKRIASELHDSLGQNLLVIRNRALLGLKDSALSQNAQEQLNQISAVASQAIDEVRQISHGLRPYQLDRLGLTKAIGSITSGLATPVKFSVAIDQVDEIVEKDNAIHVYRIVQEAVNNILKHSDATEARVEIAKEQGQVRITIADNGRGTRAERPADTSDRKGFGLLGIEERTKTLNGLVQFESSPGKGTTLTVIIPTKG